VTVDGAPVQGVRISFVPIGDVADPGPGSFGVTDADGRYSLTVVGTKSSGAVIGKHRVSMAALQNEDMIKMTEEEVAKAERDGQILRDVGLPREAIQGLIEFVVEASGTDSADFEF
jgi:hypothetical protein